MPSTHDAPRVVGRVLLVLAGAAILTSLVAALVAEPEAEPTDEHGATIDRFEPLPDGARPVIRPGTLAPAPVVQLAAGGGATCARLADGSVWCWGRQPGVLDPLAGGARFVERAEGATRVHASSTSTCAVQERGTIACWQSNWGLGDIAEHTPEVDALLRAVGAVDQLALGGFHACARRGGRVHCWGRADNGLLPTGSRAQGRPMPPTEVEGLDDVVDVEAGYNHACAIHADRTVSCWGRNSEGEVGDGSTTPRRGAVRVQGLAGVEELALGHFFSCARTSDERVHCWGDYTRSFSGHEALRPVEVLGGATRLVAGHDTWCAIVEEGRVFCGGRHLARALPFVGVVDLAVNADGLCTIDAGRTLRCARWRDGVFAPLTALPQAEDVAEVTLGRELCVRSAGGSVRCASLSAPSSPEAAPLPSRVPIPPAAEVALGPASACARAEDGAVHCWRQGEEAPSEMERLRGASGIALGPHHGCALFEGEARCFGDGAHAQLGAPGRDIAEIPVAVAGITNVAELAVGARHSCARTTDGRLFCWGDDTYAQAGGGGGGWIVRPREVLIEEEVLEVGAGGFHTCARIAGGAVRCWGRSERSRLGVQQEVVASPRDIGLEATALGVGGELVCAATPEGLRCNDAPSPWRLVADTARAVDIAVGAAHACVLLSERDVRCFGSGELGSLGRDIPPEVTEVPCRPSPCSREELVEITSDGNVSRVAW